MPNKNSKTSQNNDPMQDLKLETANEVMTDELGGNVTADNYEKKLDQLKYEVAEDLGLKEKIENVGWENMTTKEVGKIGGHMGGKIGGNMVKKMIAMAEENMLNQRKTEQ